MPTYRAIVIGSSMGGLKALETILRALPDDFAIPIAIVQHVSPDQGGILAATLSERVKVAVKEAEDKESLVAGTIYIAPPNYHLLIESDETFSLSVDEKENYSRPAIDVLFESAADVFGGSLVGVVLTGANSDGAMGLKRIQEKGGLAIVQDPETAQAKAMPAAALQATKPDYVVPLEEIGPFLASLGISGEKDG